MMDIKPSDSEENPDSTTVSQDFNQDKDVLGDKNTSENAKETKKGDDESLIEMTYNKTLTSLTVNEVISQMNNAILILNIVCTFETHNSLKAQATIKIFHTSAEGIPYVPVAPNTYLVVSYLQLAFEQYIDVYCYWKEFIHRMMILSRVVTSFHLFLIEKKFWPAIYVKH